LRCSPKRKRSGLRRISSTEVFRVVPRAPRWSGPRHALVHRIGPTRRTSPGRGRQALLICLKPAIRGSSSPSIVNDAPRTIGRSGFLEADDGRKHTKDEQEKPHGNLQSRSGLSRQNPKIKWFSNSDSDPVILFPFATGRRAGSRVERATRKNFRSRKKYSFLICHRHLLSSGCLSSSRLEKRHTS
jgi:hypothetical protein